MTTPAPPVVDGISIRRAERADLLAIVRIERQSFPQPWPFEAFECFLGEPAFLVATDLEGEVAGYVVADASPSFGRALGHIKDVAVHPGYRGRGIATALLSRALSLLADTGVASVKLEVRRSNDAAFELYRGLGFDALRRIPEYYDDEDAIVMVCDLE